MTFAELRHFKKFADGSSNRGRRSHFSIIKHHNNLSKTSNRKWMQEDDRTSFFRFQCHPWHRQSFWGSWQLFGHKMRLGLLFLTSQKRLDFVPLSEEYMPSSMSVNTLMKSTTTFSSPDTIYSVSQLFFEFRRVTRAFLMSESHLVRSPAMTLFMVSDWWLLALFLFRITMKWYVGLCLFEALTVQFDDIEELMDDNRKSGYLLIVLVSFCSLLLWVEMTI